MSMHTLGPWTVEEYGDDDVPSLVIHSDGDTRICFMATPGRFGDNKQIAANAYLIAAAPDLLEAAQLLEKAEHDRQFCEQCSEAPEYEPETCEKCFPAFDNARITRRLAIAKAEGRS